MTIRVTFKNHPPVEYPGGVEVLSSASEQVMCILDRSGDTLAILDTPSVEKYEAIADEA